MQKIINKHAPLLLLGSLLLACLLAMLAIYYEIVFPDAPHYLLYWRTMGVLGTLLVFALLPVDLKKRVRPLILVCLVGITGLLLTSFLARVINIYRWEPLPTYYYQLKLFRIVTISPIFILHNYFLFGGLWYLILISVPLKKIVSIKNILATILSFYLILHLQGVLALAYSDLVQSIQAVPTNDKDRLAYKLRGQIFNGWIVPYTEFIKAATEESAIIIIPPQGSTWPMEGNIDYLRWFLYPRTLKHLNPDNSIPEEAQYLLIAKGDCNYQNCGWPKMDIPADQIEYIKIIEPETQTITTQTNQNYRFEEYRESWGLLKLKE